MPRKSTEFFYHLDLELKLTQCGKNSQSVLGQQTTLSRLQRFCLKPATVVLMLPSWPSASLLIPVRGHTMYPTLKMIVNKNKDLNSPYRYSVHRDFNTMIKRSLKDHLFYGKELGDCTINYSAFYGELWLPTIHN